MPQIRHVNKSRIWYSFLQSIQFHAKSWLPARSVVMQCLLAREEVDPTGEIIVLTRSCPVSRNWFFLPWTNNQILLIFCLVWASILNFFRCVILIYHLCHNFLLHINNDKAVITHAYSYLLFFQWKLHIFELEEEMKINPSIKYVIYQVVIIFTYLLQSSLI